MSPEHTFQLVLAIAAAIAFLFTLWSRLTIKPTLEDEYVNRRFLLVDGLLVIAGVELIADVFRDTGTGGFFAGMVVFVCRGALVAGGLALALSVNAERRRRRALSASHHRRIGDRRVPNR